MPLNVQLVNAQVKDPQSGQMTPAGLIGSDAISTINTAKNQAIAAVQQKGEETLQSIPDDYTALSNEVDDVKTQLNDVVPFPEFPLSKFGNEGEVLRTDGEGGTEWVPMGLPSQQEFEDIVNDWLDNHSGAYVVPDNSLTYKKLVTGTLGFVTPEMFGAHGDGITDDTTALQNCFNNGNDVVLNGTYMINGTITLHSNMRISGNGKGTIIKKENPATHYSSLSYYGENTIENVIIDGLIMTGLQYWTNQTLSGYNNDFGIRIKNGHNIKVINNTMIDFGGCAINMVGNTIIVSDNTISYTGVFDVEGEPNYNFGIGYSGKNYIISNNTISGVIQGIISGTENEEVLIYANNITTNGQHGLYMEGGYKVNVISNIIHDCTLSGIKFQKQLDEDTVSNIIVADNNIFTCGSQGVFIVDLSPNHTRIQNVIITDNIIKDVPRGIDVKTCDLISVVNNVIYATSSNVMNVGIYETECSDIEISGNKIKNIIGGTSNASIFVDSTSNECYNLTIKNNLFEEVTAVYFPYDYIIENTVISGNIFTNSPGTTNILFEHGSESQNTIVCNNICDKGLKIRESSSKLKKCYNNVGIAYIDEFNMEVTSVNYVSINSQKCYFVGNETHLNLDLHCEIRGSRKKALTYAVSGLNLPLSTTIPVKLLSYSTPTTSVLSGLVAYDGSELYIELGEGNVGSNYYLSMVI